MIYDIIGDIHGQAGKLKGLLATLGYHHDGKSHIAPPNHQAIFIGDLIDRGAAQLETLHIVFDMIDNHQAHAIMGNHEYNAIGYMTQNEQGDYLRPRTEHNYLQHKAFLDEVGFDSPQHHHWIQRFYELPLWLEFDDFICIHACHDQHSINLLAPLLDNNKLTPQSLQLTGNPNSPEHGHLHHALMHLIKGMELPLPDGVTMTDKTGIVRHQARIKWWVNDWQHLPISQTLFANTLPDIYPDIRHDHLRQFHIGTTKPIFIGHYWLSGTPTPLSSQVVCTDYSAGKDGPLVAYRFDTNQPTLSASNFVQFYG